MAKYDYAAPTAMHERAKDGRHFIRYTVWNNKTDEVVIVDGTARECAKAMGITLETFYCAVTNARNRKVKKWTIKSRYEDGGERWKWRKQEG